ncbi:MAG: hypothetical protein K0S65_3967, partial [Labilithrix sp.]|nr:hypothetical protein [Labilithrix sp.]
MRRMNRTYVLLLTSSLLAAGCSGKTIDGGSGVNGDKLEGMSEATDNSADASASNWSLMAPLPFARTDHSVATVGGKIYVMGGYTGSMLARVDMYDPATNTWTQRADMLAPRRDFATAVIDGKIYVTGGMSFTDPNALTYLDTTEVYDPSTDTWSSLAPCPIGSPYNSVWGNLFVGGTAFMGRFYVVVFNSNATPTTSMHVYDPQTNVWTAEQTPTPSFFESAQIDMAAIGDTLYLFTSPYGPGKKATGVWTWNAEAHLWTIIQSLPDVWRSAYLASGGKLY